MSLLKAKILPRLQRCKPPLYEAFGRLLGYDSKDCYKVNAGWMVRLRLRRFASKRPCIGFGPIMQVQRQLGTRAWEIDPFVEYINAHSDTYDADIFFPDSNLDRFDALFFVKCFDFLPPERVRELKEQGKKLFYNTSDNIVLEKNYLTETWFPPLMDGIVAENPLCFEDVKGITRARYLPTPIISERFKSDYGNSDPVTIIWEGYSENMNVQEVFTPLVRRLNAELGQKVRLIYHTNLPAAKDGPIETITWQRRNWDTLRLEADIAIAYKAAEDYRKQRKPPAKVQSYMASGLPVVCTPSQADRTLIEHGKTGFFAESEQEWFDYLKALILSRELRERIGRAAREDIVERHSIGALGRQYLQLFDEVGIEHAVARSAQTAQLART